MARLQVYAVLQLPLRLPRGSSRTNADAARERWAGGSEDLRLVGFCLGQEPQRLCHR